MKELRVYKLSLLLPFIVSAAFAPGLFVGRGLPEWLEIVVVFTAYSGLAAGLPYLVLMALLLWWGRRKTEKQFKRALALSPVLLLPLFWLFIVMLTVLREGRLTAAGMSDVLFFYVPLILGYGYVYVVLVFAGVCLLKRIGAITTSAI